MSRSGTVKTKGDGSSGATLGFERKLWLAAHNLRNSTYVVLTVKLPGLSA